MEKENWILNEMKKKTSKVLQKLTGKELVLIWLTTDIQIGKCYSEKNAHTILNSILNYNYKS